MELEKDNQENTRWHVILGDVWEKQLTPVNITVKTDFPIMSSSPRGDILLMRRDDPDWTDEQMKLLPDGIRDTKADHILVEFKFTESANHDALKQALSYDFFYKRVQESIASERVQTFILSSKTPLEDIRKEMGFTKETKQGVYKNSNKIAGTVQLI
ncbi:MAG: hypothetical protein HQK66_04865 [Desulfamplus sp.]|nr:hypothetical protein [Desulfamplus sp.]